VSGRRCGLTVLGVDDPFEVRAESPWRLGDSLCKGPWLGRDAGAGRVSFPRTAAGGRRGEIPPPGPFPPVRPGPYPEPGPEPDPEPEDAAGGSVR